jgi:hypothetical protein
MKGNELGTYPPLNTLKRVADEVWIADGPIIRFGPRFVSMPFSTRMTIIRCGESEPLRPFADAADRHAQNRDRSRRHTALDHRTQPHSLLVDSGMESGISGGAGLSRPRASRSRRKTASTSRSLRSIVQWDADIDTLPVAGSCMTEVEFFHRPSRTLILTDFIENFEPQKISSRFISLPDQAWRRTGP